MTLAHYFVFCGIAALQVGSPGPSTVFVVDNAVAVGWLRAVGILTGDLLAIGALAVLSLLGVDAMLMANPRLFAALKIAGALYLLWLGVNQWRGARRGAVKATASRNDVARQPASVRALWVKSFLIGISNPKAILFFSSLLPQFVDPTQAGSATMLQLIALFVAIKLIVLGGYAGIATRVLPLLRSEGNARWGKRLTGTVLIGFGGLIALSALR
ncbi:LysE family translocator [Paraburkholderia acidisoli]|uniref:LysE family transporter n=1 Tax=Paraburkholderia acidisoli TaxID=2571748 RepID=A0A7Z2GPR4_9BURK|nr:LysE family translocator [Paraburkholderia acidisoli]QGZ65516.1 LysE family transporter [Paraburkholderia acidisoli]